ncbi:MAG TPA: hypothetical protein VNX21_03020 [Candidatus Thermoplasmatota archaeon]|nr:hypothetical protein [Candidatus Thermoplasmatota archaeon]
MPSKRNVVGPELDKAVHELLRAEVEFTRAYTQWLAAPPAQARERRSEVDAWEKRIEDAMHEAQRWQDERSPDA